MLRVLGADPRSINKGYFQKCLELYPELLQDDHCKNVLREMKKSMELEARAGRLMIDGAYQFLIPDLYAACEHWFLGIENPQGLLDGNEVWTRQYKHTEKLDVLRSPHLYKEHAVRPNVYASKPHIRQWFNTNGIYTSTHDHISKILQFDVDGDRALVVADPTIVEVAERECSDVCPLYYPMAKAAATQVTSQALYDGMVAAWSGGNIGSISNQISRIWNSGQPDEDIVKVLCMENNFVIDYAKTLYKTTRPPEWDERIHSATKGKVPCFFQFAKGKTESQVEPRGIGVVDRIYDAVQIYKFKFNASALGVFDYKMLMYDKEIPYGEKEQQIVKEFRRASASMGTSPGLGLYDDDNQYWLRVKELRKKILQYGSVQYVSDVLVRGLFHEHHVRKKSAFWDCFGNTIYENLLNNLPEGTKLCYGCGKRIPIGGGRRYCEACQPREAVPTVQVAECVICGEKYMTRDHQEGAMCPACAHMKSAGGRCVDCGTLLPERMMGRPSNRCSACQQHRRRELTKHRVIKYRCNA